MSTEAAESLWLLFVGVELAGKKIHQRGSEEKHGPFALCRRRRRVVLCWPPEEEEEEEEGKRE